MTTESDTPSPAQIGFTTWFNQEQPLLHIQDEAKQKIYDQALFRAIRGQVEAAYRAGWEARKLEDFRRMYDGSENQ